MPRPGCVSDQVANLRAEVEKLVPSPLSPSNPLYALVVFQPASQPLVQYQFILQSRRTLLQALYYLQEREAELQFCIDTQSQFQMSRSR